MKSHAGLILLLAAVLAPGCGLIAGLGDFKDAVTTSAGGGGSGSGTTSSSSVLGCGDGEINGAEECDSDDLGGKSCPDVGVFYGGALACDPGTCKLDTSGCFGAPSVPLLRKPSNNAYYPRFAKYPIKFAWGTSALPSPADPAAGITYHLQFGTDPAFAAGTQTIAQGATIYPETGSPNFMVDLVKQKPTGDHFYWRVNACAGVPGGPVACSAYSPTWHLHMLRSPGDLNGDGYDDLVVAAPYAADPSGDAGTVPDVGAVTFYPGGASFGTAPPGGSVHLGSAAGAQIGYVLARAGDVNGDGFGDLLVNAPGGNVHLHLGGPNGPFDGAPILIAVNSAYPRGIAAAGDVNGDGYADILFTRPLPDKSRIYWGGPTWTGEYDEIPEPGSATEGFGGLAAPAGDLDGDGFGDFVVADYTANNAKGYVWIYFGRPEGPPVLAAEIDGLGDGGQSGRAVLGCDVNDDGFSDLVIGSPAYPANVNYGTARLYLGGSMFSTGNPVSLPNPDASTYGLAQSIACGDVTGDGIPDLVLGAPYGGVSVQTLSQQGTIQVHWGQASIPPTFVHSEQKGGAAADDWLGYAVAIPGDLDGDGIADIAASAPKSGFYMPPHTPAGYVSVFLGVQNAVSKVGPVFNGAPGEGFGHLVGP